MFNFDFSKDKPNISEPVPAGAKVLVRMTYTPGGADFHNTPVAEKRGQLTASKEGDALYLKAEFTILRGPYKGRKFWENMTFAGGKLNERGESIAAGITRGNIRSILDASTGTSSKDETPAACAKRVLPNGFADLNGRVFPIKIGVEGAKGNYAAKNKLGTILTPDHKDWPKDESEFDNVLVPAAAKLPTVAAPSWGAPTTAAPAPTPAAGFAQPSATVPVVGPDAVATKTVPQGATIATQDSGIPAWARA